MLPHWAPISLLVILVQWSTVFRPRPRPQGAGAAASPSIPSRLLLKALDIMIGKHGPTPSAQRTVWAQDPPARRALRPLLTEHGRYPTRRTWERRLATLPDKLPAQMRCRGTHLVGRIQPWAANGWAGAADSTVLRAKGGVWHQKHREVGEVPPPPLTPQRTGSTGGDRAGSMAG